MIFTTTTTYPSIFRRVGLRVIYWPMQFWLIFAKFWLTLQWPSPFLRRVESFPVLGFCICPSTTCSVFIWFAFSAGTWVWSFGTCLQSVWSCGYFSSWAKSETVPTWLIILFIFFQARAVCFKTPQHSTRVTALFYGVIRTFFSLFIISIWPRAANLLIFTPFWTISIAKWSLPEAQSITGDDYWLIIRVPTSLPISVCFSPSIPIVRCAFTCWCLLASTQSKEAISGIL